MERNVLSTIGLPFDVSPVNSNAADVLPHRRRYPLETVVLSQSLDRSVLVVLTNRMARSSNMVLSALLAGSVHNAGARQSSSTRKKIGRTHSGAKWYSMPWSLWLTCPDNGLNAQGR